MIKIQNDMKLWRDDEELFEIAKKELFTALVGDILDKLGYQHQFLSPQVKPIKTDMSFICCLRSPSVAMVWIPYKYGKC